MQSMLIFANIVFYSHDDGRGWMESTADKQRSDKWTAEISNLTPDNSYDFRVVAKYHHDQGMNTYTSNPLPNIMTREYNI